MVGTPTPPNSTHKRLLYLEWEVAQLRQLLADRPAQQVPPRLVRLAITVDHSYPSESGSGHVKVPIKFIDAKFPNTIGWESSLTTQTREDTGDDYQVIAANVAEDVFIPPGTIVWALWQRAIKGITATANDGEWWLMQSAGTGTGGVQCEIGLCDTASHNPDTYQTYDVYELNSGTTPPSAKDPGETIEAWNETGQILSDANMGLLIPVSADSGANGNHIVWPLPLEACPGT